MVVQLGSSKGFW